MKYIKLFEKFTKEYQQKIDVKDFKKRIKKGSKVQYMGGTVDVIDNNGYVLTLKGEDGKKFTVNKNQFDHGGRISESLTIKGKKVKKINKKGNDPENWTITYKDGTEEPYLQHMRESMIGITTDKSFKPADLQKALDKAKIKGYKMDRLSMTLTALKLDKKYFNDAKKLIDDLGLSVMMAKEGKLNESKGKKVVSDIYKMDGQIDYLSDADEPTKKFWKKKGFNPDDDNLIILYSYPNDWYDITKLLKKSKLKYTEFEDPNSAGESFIVFDVNEGNVNEGIEWQGILLKDATLRYNNKPTGGPVGSLQWVGQSYAKVPKGTFLIGLPGGLFAVNPKKKFAMALTTGKRTWLDAQDKLKGNEVGGTNMAPEYREWKQYLKESVNERRDEWKQEREYIKQMADDNKSSVYKMADYVQFLGLMNQKQWEKFMYGMYKKDLQKTDPKTKNKIYKVFTKMFESKLNEGAMSDIHLLAKEAKDEKDFINKFFQSYGDKVKNNSAGYKWVKDLYKDMNEGNVEEVYDGKKKKKKKNPFHPDMMYEARAKKVTKQMWKRMNDDKRFDALLSVIKDPDDAEEYVDYKWEELPVNTDMYLFELSSAQDGTKESDGKHKHDDHMEEDVEAMWKKTYGEDFKKHYPAIVKILRQRPGMDKRELARIWNDTYGEDFEKEYPALYNKLS